MTHALVAVTYPKFNVNPTTGEASPCRQFLVIDEDRTIIEFYFNEWNPAEYETDLDEPVRPAHFEIMELPALVA